jgi:hydroxylamine reductase
MFCFQCQEAAKNEGCTVRGICGKEPETSDLQDVLIYAVKGCAWCADQLDDWKSVQPDLGLFIARALFASITNANFDNARFEELITEAIKRMVALEHAMLPGQMEKAPAAARYRGEKSVPEAGILSETNEDIRSLRELAIYGLKGVAAYTDHAAVLGLEDDALYGSFISILSRLTTEEDIETLIGIVMETGETAVKGMELLDRANTGTYGNPEISKVNLGVGKRPGILISGHDLKDLSELLEQSRESGVDIYTHSEMLPAHYYPVFKKYDHFFGNYGGSWWHQNREFEAFNGPILMTTNCIVPVKESYRDRIYTTGMAGYPGVVHIPDRDQDGRKDFSAIIEQAKGCKAPTELETGFITGGFAHSQTLALADKIAEAVKSGAIKRFIVMAGCDGRQKGRSYFTEVAETLPEDAVILTAGCAKYRYLKLNLGDIGGIPRVLDAGQCNDSYSLAVIALKLKEMFGLDDLNKLPISFDLAWYEQKAVAVLLALLFLGFKSIRLGPTLPAFLSPAVAKVLVEKFNIMPIGDVETDVQAMMAGA